MVLKTAASELLQTAAYAALIADVRISASGAINSSTCVDENNPSGPCGLTPVNRDS